MLNVFDREVKQWKPMTLGEITLPKGRAELQLRATKATSENVADMRLLLFRRLSAEGS